MAEAEAKMAGVGWIMTIILGGLAGWIAEKVMKSDMGLIGEHHPRYHRRRWC